MIIRHLNLRRLGYVAKMRFSGGHGHHKAYDWRDDPNVNESYEQDVRQIGLKDPLQYEFPHTAQPYQWHYSAPLDYNQKDLTQNLRSSPRTLEIKNALSPPETDWLADIAHEKDYESEDLDFQPQSFKTQHFRKKGPLWMWVIACSTPLWLIYSDVFHQSWGDEDNYRYQRPPPLHYPDQEDTPDAEDYLTFQSPQFAQMWDAGVAKRAYKKVQDGKKIFYRHAGVNQPPQIPQL